MSTRSRAERFEDEKKRITESCFGKKDGDGSLLESYITHIRISEDAAYPSSPPPPESPPSNKKPRLIIVAVRKSGRVRMHKARENANGTFSIGKTWVLDDLSAIQTYAGPPAATPDEEQQRQWAGGVGFLVTIVKPYYWQAATSKEKDFFIASLVKIYKKYTGGKLPELAGFDASELQQLVSGGQYRSSSVDSRKGSVADSSRQASVSTTNIPTPTLPQPDSSSRRPSETQPRKQSEAQPRRPSEPQNRRPSDQTQTSIDSRNGALPGNGVHITPRAFGSETNGDTQKQPPTPNVIPDAYRKESRSSPRSFEKKSRLAPQTSSDHFMSGTDDSGPPSRNESPLPMREDTMKRSEKRSMDEGRSLTARSFKAPQTKPDISPRSTPPPGATAPVTSPTPDRSEEEEHRPGLGPMIKQKSKRDLAGTFRKAALAYGAFKPRTATDANNAPNAPDGISAVVPAPSRGMSQDSTSKAVDDNKSKEKTPVQASQETVVPELTVTATSPAPGSRKGSGLPFGSPQKPAKEPRVISAGPKSPKRQLTQRPKTSPSETARHVSALGINPSLVQGSTVDIESVLKEFGCWEGEAGRNKSPDTLDAELRRELGRVEAGSWLGQSDQKDERVEAVERLLDKAIAECDELEGLLTLYSVELSTLNDDVAFIESQSQGLQVQTSNQKLLQAELQNQLQTLPVPSK